MDKKEKWKNLLYEQSGIMKKPVRIVIVAFILVILFAGVLILYYNNPKEHQIMLACPIYTLTGYYCPGCGAGRACYSILHGQIYQGFRYNPLLILILPWLALYYLTSGIQWLRTGRARLMTSLPEWIAYTVLVLLIAYGVVRNLDVYPFILLAPTEV